MAIFWIVVAASASRIFIITNIAENWDLKDSNNFLTQNCSPQQKKKKTQQKPGGPNKDCHLIKGIAELIFKFLSLLIPLIN